MGPIVAPASPTRLVVIGGGFTGAALVTHLVRDVGRALDITIVEPSEALGRGIAYGTIDPAHRINVPSERMGLRQDDPSGATRWMFDHGILPDAGSEDGQGNYYVPREAYGAFVADTLRRTLAEARGRVTFLHRRRSATAVVREGAGWRVDLDDGMRIAADVVALCFGHAVPHRPCVLGDAVRQSPKFVPDPWARGALRGIEPTDCVLVVGTGLTMADVVVSLRQTGHTGPITALSRRGLLSQPHGQFLSGIDILDGEPAPRTALGLLRLARRRVRDWGPRLGWPPIADALRFKLPVLWAALPPREKGRVLRRLLPFWEIHRFRIAPQIHEALERDRAAGGLTVERGGLIGLDRREARFAASLRRPGGQVDTLSGDAVVLCTGPEKDVTRNPLVASLMDSGLARLDEVGLGLAVDGGSHVLRPDGRPWPTLFAFGPMTRGSFGEMTGAPDITKHLEGLAGSLFDGVPATEAAVHAG